MGPILDSPVWRKDKQGELIAVRWGLNEVRAKANTAVKDGGAMFGNKSRLLFRS